MVRYSKVLCMTAWLCAAGCMESPSRGATLVHEGSLSLALSATDSNGDDYRLRDATFHLVGCSDDYFPMRSQMPGSNESETLYAAQCTDVTLSTEDHLGKTVITRQLLPGRYSVTLNGDWYLERKYAGGDWTRAKRVVLLSPAFQQTQVRDGASEQISYVFGVGGNPIDFRHGDINIGIEVELPDADTDAGAW